MAPFAVAHLQNAEAHGLELLWTLRALRYPGPTAAGGRMPRSRAALFATCLFRPSSRATHASICGGDSLFSILPTRSCGLPPQHAGSATVRSATRTAPRSDGHAYRIAPGTSGVQARCTNRGLQRAPSGGDFGCRPVPRRAPLRRPERSPRALRVLRPLDRTHDPLSASRSRRRLALVPDRSGTNPGTPTW